MAGSLRQAPIACPGHTRPVVDIYFGEYSYDVPLFVTAGKDGKAILRRGDTGDWIGSFTGHKGAVWACTLDSQSERAATGAADFTAKIWSVNDGSELLSLTEEHIVRAIGFSNTDNGAHLLTASNSKKMTVYDLSSPNTPLRSFTGHTQLIRRAFWCDGDRRILSISEDKTVRLWDLCSGDTMEPVITTSLWTSQLMDVPYDLQWKDNEWDLQATGNSQCLVLACGNSVNQFTLDWRQPACSPSYTNLATLGCSVFTVSCHPTEPFLVCGGEDHVIYRFDTSTNEVVETCKGHFGPVHCVRYSSNGRLFVSGSEDGTVRLWQNQVGDVYGLWQLSGAAESASLPSEVEPTCIPLQMDTSGTVTSV